MGREQPNRVDQLSEALWQAEVLLAAHGDVYVTPRLADLRARLARGDRTAIRTALSESTGSMGSLRDRYLHPANGDLIGLDQVVEVNATLTQLVRAIKHAAKAAQAEIQQ
jgi:hypothetical protein